MPRSYRYCQFFIAPSISCTRGIDVAGVRDREGRLPCVVVDGVTGEIDCIRRQILGPSPSAEAGALEKALANLCDGRCPTCGDPIDEEADYNGRVIAMPCRHVIRSVLDKETP